MKKEFSTLLDMSRWLAAFFVVISHIRHIVLADYGEVVNKNLFVKIVYAVTGLGHEAVMVFFVLSGFLVGGTTLKKWKKVSIPDYFVHRFCRIYTVLIPALMAGCALDYVGSVYFNGSELYTNATHYGTNSLKASIFNDLSFVAFLKSLCMTGAHLGSNAPLWSLVYEWWYYCIFAACFALVLRKGIYAKLLSVLGLAFLAVYCTAGLWIWMTIWWLGVAVYFYCESDLPRPPAWVSVPLFIASLVMSRISTHNISVNGEPNFSTSFTNDMGVGLGYSILLISLRDCSGRFLLSFSKLHQKMADFSYSLYLVHFPMLIFIVATMHDTLGLAFLGQPDLPANILYCFAILAGLYAYGYLFFLCTEKHTGKIRRAISRLLEKAGIQLKPVSELHTLQDIAPQRVPEINDSPHIPVA